MKNIHALCLSVGIATASLTGFVSHASAASCSATEASEVTRLRGEISSLLKKNAHSGVVSSSEKLFALGKQGCEVKPDDYKSAGYSAQQLGDIAAALGWYKAGNATNDVANITTRYGEVAIKEKAGDLAKEGGMPFAPDERAALERATTALKKNGKYEGFLPLGKYTLGTKTFEAVAGKLTKL